MPVEIGCGLLATLRHDIFVAANLFMVIGYGLGMGYGYHTMIVVKRCVCFGRLLVETTTSQLFLSGPSMATVIRRVACLVISGATSRGAMGFIKPCPVGRMSMMRAAIVSTKLMEEPTPSRRTLAYPLTQVVSDIDDTLKSSGGLEIGGVSLGGIDVQYNRGDFYP